MVGYSQEIGSILGRPPKSLVRYGTAVFLLGLVVILIGAMVIDYPKKVNGKLTITTIELPVSVVASTGGYVELFVEEGDQVKYSTPLALITNPARLIDIRQLSTWTDSLLSLQLINFDSLYIYEGLSLGSVQEPYLNVKGAIYQLQLKSNDPLSGKRRKRYRQQIRNGKASINLLEDKIFILEKKVEVSKRRLPAQKLKYSNNRITIDAYNKYLEGIRKDEAEVQELKLNIEGLQSAIANFKFKIDEGDLYSIQNQRSGYQEVEFQLGLLRGAIDDWFSRYLVLSPIEGRVTLFDAQVGQQYVDDKSAFMAILPSMSEQKLIGRMHLPFAGSARVEEGQRVIVKLDTYPFLEYGFVEGVVQSKALLPSPDEEGYQVQIKLESGLITSKGIELEFRQNMLAKAEIIIHDASVMNRLLEGIAESFGRQLH